MSSIIKTKLVDIAEQYVRTLLGDKLSVDFKYHDLPHTLTVRDVCLELAKEFSLSDDELEILELAALFHDTGYSETYVGHEALSHQIASQFLTNHNYSPHKMEQVLACIEATFPNKVPQNLLEEIIKDADLNNLGKDTFLETAEGLRHEWAVFLNQTFSDEEWNQLNYKFLKQQDYYTEAAKTIYGSQLKANRKMLKKMVKEKNQPTIAAVDSKGNNINSNKSAQMMFKTALRNHLDLSNLADNKANIMLSVNAVIITIVMPVAASYIKDNIYLIVPLICLMGTCLASMIYATLATRPIKMNGYTSPDVVEKGESNLFFFGNFYQMAFEEYQGGMTKVVSNEKRLDNSIMRDLFFLGKSLGRKYRQLRVCYTIFMYGIIFTVLVFAVSYSLYVAAL